MDDGVSVDRRAPGETFGLLGNEIRVAILEALAETPEEPRSFSALQSAVGERDSGKFNYHLRKLTDHFVKHTDAGYELSLAGKQVVGALLAGTYTADARMDPIHVDEPCPLCGAHPLVLEYEDELVTMRCTECEVFRNQFAFPPGSLDQYAPEELPEAVDRWLMTTFFGIVQGFCPTCGGRMDGGLVVGGDWDYPDPVRGEYVCSRCGDRASTSAILPLYFHPAVVGFFYDHGVDVFDAPTWRMTAAQDEFGVDLVATDPPTARVSITMGDETLVATVDESAAVTAVERSADEQK